MKIFELDALVRAQTDHRFSVTNIRQTEDMRDALASYGMALSGAQARLCRG